MSENFDTNNNERNNTPSQMKETRYFTCYNVTQMKNENQVFPYICAFFKHVSYPTFIQVIHELVHVGII